MSDDNFDRKISPNDSSDGDSPTSYVKLISAEGHEFYLERRIALAGKTLKAMLEGQFREAEEALIHFPEISSHILEKVIQYLHYKVRHTHSTVRIPEFQIRPEIALELLVAASYLDC
mmetsp:Transcript_11747/g.14610  ORF Transcript_11747/g.14610 Transcript_11747/m.14610 type:complete len:117 (-) Transcript_11747:175-525(-)|eukprot:CAMPEP_0172517582 /NCGR_PEP_ID=MMETSP1066-20121228/286264_1 /TAXON_ID=671091 /ORGANISM="Coscinodiscus wailesii, Strain CCMP2513" /LENGTH=116 /DNA_ID=CAMNT_0013299661 /DNA_START=105 /DNA_END=455 /DNA_ORIENTATION=+